MKLNRKSSSNKFISSISGYMSSMRSEPSYNAIGNDDDVASHHHDDFGDKENRSQAKSFEIKAMHQASWTSCVINLSSTILGAGILGIPYAFSLMGWIPGILCLLFSAACSFFGLHLMAECALQLPGVSSFYAVAQSTIPEYATLVDLLVTIKGFGTVTAYILVVADSITSAFKSSSWTFLRSRFWVISLSYMIIGPLSYFPSLDSLKFSSALSVIMMLVLALMIVVYAFDMKNSIFDPCPSEEKPAEDIPCFAENVIFTGNVASTLRAFPIFLFCFSCQQNAFTVVNELKDPSRKRLNSIFLASITSSWIINIIVGVCGYATFGAMTQSDILRNYPENMLTSTCRVLMALVVICHYPLQLHPSRRTALSLWQRFFPILPPSAGLSSSSATSPTSFSTMSPIILNGHDEEEEKDALDEITFSTAATAAAASPSRVGLSPPNSVSRTIGTTSAGIASLDDGKSYQRRFFLYTTFFNTVVYLIGISVEDLGIVLSIMGATMSCMVILLLPGIFYYFLAVKYTNDSSNHNQSDHNGQRNRLNSFVGFELPRFSSAVTGSASDKRVVADRTKPKPDHSQQTTANNPLHSSSSVSMNEHSELSTVHLAYDDDSAGRSTATDADADADADVETTEMFLQLTRDGGGGVSLIDHSHSLRSSVIPQLLPPTPPYHHQRHHHHQQQRQLSSSTASARISEDVMPGIRWKKYAALGLVIFGLMVLVLSLTSVLILSSSSSSPSHR